MNPSTKVEQLLRAATRAASRRGFHAPKISEITTEAGVAQETFYVYFPGKSELR